MSHTARRWSQIRRLVPFLLAPLAAVYDLAVIDLANLEAVAAWTLIGVTALLFETWALPYAFLDDRS